MMPTAHSWDLICRKQAVPCVLPEAPLVATGVEALASRDSGRIVIALEDGVVSYLDAKK